MMNFIITFGEKNGIAGAFLAKDNKQAAQTAAYLTKQYMAAAKEAGQTNVTKKDFRLYPMAEVHITWKPVAKNG